MAAVTPAITAMAKAMAAHHREPKDWPAYLGLAAAALRAIRSPTREMEEAIWPMLHPDWRVHNAACYETMMDAALGEALELSQEEMDARMQEVVSLLRRAQETGKLA